MIANENGQKTYEDNENVRKLKDELNKISIENIQAQEMVSEIYKSIGQSIALTRYFFFQNSSYLQQIDQLKEHLSAEEERLKNATSVIQSLKLKIEKQDETLSDLDKTVEKQRKDIAELQKDNVRLRSKEINFDIQIHQRDQQFGEIKEENEFLKAQVGCSD